MSENTPAPSPNVDIHDRVWIGIVFTLLGLLIFLIGAKPAIFNLDRSEVVGFVQIVVFEFGLAFICLGGYIGLAALWRNEEKSILADIGLRLVSTGYVISIFSGMADIFGMGTQPFPRVPFFGPWQAVGVEFGMILIALGMLFLIPYHHFQKPYKA